jgi:hypothetical protein
MSHIRQRLNLEALEDRHLLATCHVVRLGDFGAGGTIGDFSRGDLRFCIEKANDTPGHDTINLNVTGTINLTGPLPDLASDMDILGPGSDALTVRRNTGGNYRILTVTPGATVRITGLHMMNGLVVNDVGGGILNRGNMTVDDIRLFGNEASDNGTSYDPKGGGIYNEGSLIISYSTIDSNKSRTTSGSWVSASGGGIYNTGTLTISDSTLSENLAYAQGSSSADAMGGAIQNENGIVTINRSTVANNEAGGYGCQFGGGGFGAGIGSSGTLTVADSTISGNFAWSIGCGDNSAANGGAIYMFSGGKLNLVNSTVTQNKVDSDGWASGTGGIKTTSTTTITNSTIVGSAQGIEIHGPLTLRNSIIQGLNGTISSSGYNLIIYSAGGSGYVPSDILNVDPMLGPLQNNGGPTQTMALLPGSPAIDSGTNQGAPEWDQRGPGFPRIVNGTIDRGAFEAQATGAPAPLLDLALLITADLEALS